MFKDVVKGVYAGILIAIGCIVNLSVNNSVVGSFLFSIGLLTICVYNMNLYTGKVGYVIYEKPKYLITVLMSLIGNYIGTFVVGLLVKLTRLDIIDKARVISNIKLNDSLISIFVLSIFCGMLMFIAVNNYKNGKDTIIKYLSIIMCVMVFILSGFEHSIANMGYFLVSGIYTLKSYIYILVMVLGNAAGAILVSVYDKYLK